MLAMRALLGLGRPPQFSREKEKGDSNADIINNTRKRGKKNAPAILIEKNTE